jgi:hypothetical protein
MPNSHPTKTKRRPKAPANTQLVAAKVRRYALKVTGADRKVRLCRSMLKQTDQPNELFY